MKNHRKVICLLLTVVFSIAFFTGCAKETDKPFTYSEGIDDNGFLIGIKALDYVDIFDYIGMSIPSDIHQISDDDVQAEIDSLLSYFTSTEEITDREVVDGDTVNIDYIGSVDGIEFDGGSTGGEGTDVTAGSTDYIDDFLMQIIGHMPGETIDVEVTFPDDYHDSSLQGKNAVFVTTINYITDTISEELTDEFVETNLFEYYGWTTIDEMKESIRKDLQTNSIEEYIMEYMRYDVTAESIPDTLADYQLKVMQKYYQNYADQYGVDLEEFLSTYVGVSGMDELIESTQEDNTSSARYTLVVQAVAEDADISVDIEDLVAFFTTYIGVSDYSAYEEEFGLPYLMQLTLQNKVLEFMIENAVLL